MKFLTALLCATAMAATTACHSEVTYLNDGGLDDSGTVACASLGDDINFPDACTPGCTVESCDRQLSALESACMTNAGLWSCGCTCSPSDPACLQSCESITNSSACSSARQDYASCIKSSCSPSCRTSISVADAAIPATFIGPDGNQIAFGSPCVGDVYFPDGSGWAFCDDAVWGYATTNPASLGGYTLYQGDGG
jgi:hypothetical protein